jgi:hypothetical protein
MHEEQWYVVDTHVYTCLDIGESKNHTSCVLIGYGLQGRSGSVIIVPNWDSFSTYLIYKIYLWLSLNRLDYRAPGSGPWPEWADSWQPPCPSPPSPGDLVPMLSNLISSPECLESELWSWLSNPPYSDEVAECSVCYGITCWVLFGSGWVLNGSDRVPLS